MSASRVALLFGLIAVTSARFLQEECSALYGQCGGLKWTGPTCCVAGSTCVPQQGNKYYSQCLPSSASPSTPSTPSTPATPNIPSTPGGIPPTDMFSTADPRLSQAEELEILAAFDTWNAALQTLNPEAVADCYNPDGILVPTISNDIRTTRAEIIDYFVLFLSKKPVGKLNEFNIRLEGSQDGSPTIVSNAGIYTFTFGDGSTTSARYTFVYKKVGGVWKIHEHHSSQLPSKFKTLPPTGPPDYKNSSDPELSSAEAAGILKAFDEWNAALATLNPKEVARKYTDDAILLPTVSDDVRTTTAEIEDYFVKFLANEPQGVINEYHLRLESVDEIGEPLEVSNSGIYTFTFAKTGESVTARYTIIYERFRSMNPRSMWLIKQQHSSQLPQA